MDSESPNGNIPDYICLDCIAFLDGMGNLVTEKRIRYGKSATDMAGIV